MLGIPTKSRAKVKQRLSGLVAKATETLLPAQTVEKLRTRREWKRWIASIRPESLSDLSHAPLDVQSAVFKAHVQRVEIETHAKCNRICSFCPNVRVDRRLNTTVADSRLLDRVFEELGSIDYAGQIAVARYSEPLTNVPYLCDRLSRARSVVPRAQLCITTNTDYLKPGVLDQLEAAGLNIVYMSLYLLDRERWSIDVARAHTSRLEKKLGLRRLSWVETATNVSASYGYKTMHLRSNCRNWDQYGTDRGGSLSRYNEEPRVGPCRDPFETFVIDYNGSVMPCCALRSDIPEHRSLAVGDLSQPGTSIFTIYAGQLASWRRGLASFGPKSSPCTTCQHREVPADLAPELSRALDVRLRQIGLGEHSGSSSSTGGTAPAASIGERAPLYSIGSPTVGGAVRPSPNSRINANDNA